MKKRLLITSIVMMLVVAVALSTATYAWFTQNAIATASNVTMTAAVSDAQSISIAWLGSETKSTSLTGMTNSSSLQPMAPSILTGTNASTVAFSGAYVDTSGKLIDAAGAAKGNGTLVPYTWTDGTVSAFYINNDSNSTPLNIDVAATITDTGTGAARTALANGTLLEGSGKVYYKKAGTTYTALIPGTAEQVQAGTAEYVPNVTTVSDELKTACGATDGIFQSKGVADYVRIAIYATTAQSTPLVVSGESNVFSAANCTYKGLIANTNSATTTLWSTGETPAAPTLGTTMASALNTTASDSDSVVRVIENLPALNRVYIVVKVWLDGANFTQHENEQTASVTLTFNASTYTAPAQAQQP